jgi:hypothetical protein
VHVHADILDVTTHLSCLLGGKSIRVYGAFPSRQCAILQLPRLFSSAVLSGEANYGCLLAPPQPSEALHSAAQRGGASSTLTLLKRAALS